LLIRVHANIIYRVKIYVLRLLPPLRLLPLHVLLSQVDAMLHIILSEVLLHAIYASLGHIYAAIVNSIAVDASRGHLGLPGGVLRLDF
jgi:hypothetical protein